MSQSQITDCTMAWVRRALCIALSELLFGASSDVIIPRASFSTARLLASCFFFGSGVCGDLGMTGPFQDWIVGRLVFGI